MSDAVAELNITGNVIPSVWFKTIVNDKGRPYMLAIMILSEVVYWYRPVECRDEKTGEFLGYKTKFRQDVLQKSYKDLPGNKASSDGRYCCAGKIRRC